MSLDALSRRFAFLKIQRIPKPRLNDAINDQERVAMAKIQRCKDDEGE